MEDDVFTRIVDQLSKYHIKKFCPYLENEPFLDKKLFDRVQYAIDVLKPEVVEISSNLSLLQVWHIEGLVNVLSKVPHELRISFHGIDKNSYENIMELDYEKSLANVKTVVAMMQEMPLNVMIRCSGEPRQSMKNNAHRWFGEEEFKQFWQHELADYKTLPVLDFFTYHDRAGQDQLHQVQGRDDRGYCGAAAITGQERYFGPEVRRRQTGWHPEDPLRKIMCTH